MHYSLRGHDNLRLSNYRLVYYYDMSCFGNYLKYDDYVLSNAALGGSSDSDRSWSYLSCSSLFILCHETICI